MNSLNDYSVVSLLPDSLKQDPFIIALAEAVEIELKEAYREAESMSDFSDVDKLPELLLDYIAFQKHVDFYDNSLPVEMKRSLVKDSMRTHRMKGTPRAVELLIETVFGDGEVEEWYEYNGEPGYFRILTRNTSVTGAEAQKLISVLERVKRKSAWLDEIIILVDGNLDIFYGFALHVGDYMTVRQGA